MRVILLVLTLPGLIFVARGDYAYEGNSTNAVSATMPPQSQEGLNVQWLQSIDQIQRVIPHRVNTLGKFNDIFSVGCRAFELDVIFRNNGVKGFLEIGHDEATKTGADLADFLNRIQLSEVKKIWLDVKNLEENNLDELKEVLIGLDQSFDLKGKVIFESSMVSARLSEISDQGFHVSYYLPTDPLLALLRSKNTTLLAQEAVRISEQIAKQRVIAVSFDARLYVFVKKWLQKRIPKNIVYHTWDLSLSLNSKRFVMKMQGKEYFRDPRVQTILVPFESIFSL